MFMRTLAFGITVVEANQRAKTRQVPSVFISSLEFGTQFLCSISLLLSPHPPYDSFILPTQLHHNLVIATTKTESFQFEEENSESLQTFGIITFLN